MDREEEEEKRRQNREYRAACHLGEWKGEGQLERGEKLSYICQIELIRLTWVLINRTSHFMLFLSIPFSIFIISCT